MIDLKSATPTDYLDSKPPTSSVLIISNKDSSLKAEDLITFQMKGINKDSSKGFSKGILSGSVVIDMHNTSKNSVHL